MNGLSRKQSNANTILGLLFKNKRIYEENLNLNLSQSFAVYYE